MRLDRTRLVRTFVEEFDRPLSIYDPVKRAGRWTTHYWFADPAGPSSRTLPAERQVYVDPAYCGLNPFSQAKGELRITAAPNARRDDPRTAGKPYTSGLITTENAFRQRYGYFEARMAMPQVRGCWPAFWLLGPHNPSIQTPQKLDEIDVVEVLGRQPTTLHHSVHKGEFARTATVPRFPTVFERTYGTLWTAETIVWYVDDNEVARMPNPGLTQPMYMLLNLAVGGWDGNLPEDAARFPATLRIQYVKAYRLG